jgi:DNA-binding FadR family transcriptional regulator
VAAGTFVVENEGPPALDSNALRLMASLQRFTPAEMFEARRSLEMAIAALAAERSTGEQMAEMSEEITGMFASLDEPEQFLVHDMRFHQTVAAASGNRILTALMNMVATILLEVRSKTVKRARDLKDRRRCIARFIARFANAIPKPRALRCAITSCSRRRPRKRKKKTSHKRNYVSNKQAGS